MPEVPIHKEDEAGLLMYRKADLAATAAAVKASSTRLFTVNIDNTANAAKTYVHFYDALAANVTVGTTVPVKTLVVPASGGYDFYWVKPPAFAIGLTIAATTTVGGLTAPSSSVLINIDYR